MLQAGPLSASSGFSSFNVARYKRGTTSGLPQRKSKPLDKFAKNRIFPPKNKCYELWINYELWCIIVCLCMYQGIDSQYRYNHATQMCAIISYNKNWDTYVHVHDWSQNIKSPPDLLQYPLAWLSLARCQLGLSTPQPGNLPENVKPVKPVKPSKDFPAESPKQPSDSGGHACSSVIFPSKASTSGQELFLSPTKVSFKDQVTKVYKISGTDSMNLWISRTLAIQKRKSEPKLW